MPVITSLSIYKLISMIELLIAEGLFAQKLNRKSHFWVRSTLSVLGILAITFFFPVLYYDAWYVSMMYIVLFLLTIPAFKICFEENWWNLTFCAFAAYTVKQLAFVLSYTVIDTFGIWSLFNTGGTAVNPYSSSSELFQGQTPFTILAFVNIYFLVYWAAHFLLVNNMEKGDDMRFGGPVYLFLSAVIVLTDVVFNMIAIYDMTDATAILIERLYNILTCVLSLFIQFSLLQGRKSKIELSVTQELLRKNEKQYQMTKDNINLINLKCHDLKHQIRKIGEMETIDKAALTEVSHAVSFYESVVKTGNEALDTILTEKSLFCEKNGIKLTCIVDGEKLRFLTPTDTYSLFGNAIDNAIEAVQKLPPSKRIITVIVKGVGNVISIHIENYFAGNIRLVDGIPLTSKEDTNYHGFGLLSIKSIAEKYHGHVAIDITDDVFNLNLLFGS